MRLRLCKQDLNTPDALDYTQLSKLFLVSDLHGSEVVLNKTINSAKFYGVKNIVIAGDLTGKLLVPIIRENEDEYSLNLFGEAKKIMAPKLAEAMKQIRNSGYYYRVVNKSEYEDLAQSKDKVKGAFLEAMKEDLRAFLSKAEERLKPFGAKLYLFPGNDDYEEVAQFIKDYRSDTIVPFDRSITELEGGYELVGYGYSNPTPWNTPREKPEDEIYKDLSELMQKTDRKKILLVTHVPPIDTIIDKAPKLTPDLKPVLVGGEYQMVSVGSTSVRRIIQEFAPVAGLHGHIHESGGVDQVKVSKRVSVFNPGSDYSAGILRGVIVQLDDDKVKNYLFTKG